MGTARLTTCLRSGVCPRPRKAACCLVLHQIHLVAAPGRSQWAGLFYSPGEKFFCPASSFLHDAGATIPGDSISGSALVAQAVGTDHMGMRTAVATLALWAATVSAAGAASAIEEMSGYWRGSGSVALTSGKTEQVQCAVTYRIGEGGGQIKQSMRCASADYSINASAELTVKGSQVTGSWEEKTYSAVGEVTGRVTGTGLVLNIKGPTFTASMNLTLSTCKQSISITPQGLEVNRISIALSKC
jgi:hypothetical protein